MWVGNYDGSVSSYKIYRCTTHHIYIFQGRRAKRVQKYRLIESSRLSPEYLNYRLPKSGGSLLKVNIPFSHIYIHIFINGSISKAILALRDCDD
jgi:hypothetical protein